MEEGRFKRHRGLPMDSCDAAEGRSKYLVL